MSYWLDLTGLVAGFSGGLLLIVRELVFGHFKNDGFLQVGVKQVVWMLAHEAVKEAEDEYTAAQNDPTRQPAYRERLRDTIQAKIRAINERKSPHQFFRPIRINLSVSNTFDEKLGKFVRRDEIDDLLDAAFDSTGNTLAWHQVIGGSDMHAVDFLADRTPLRHVQTIGVALICAGFGLQLISRIG